MQAVLSCMHLRYGSYPKVSRKYDCAHVQLVCDMRRTVSWHFYLATAIRSAVCLLLRLEPQSVLREA